MVESELLEDDGKLLAMHSLQEWRSPSALASTWTPSSVLTVVGDEEITVSTQPDPSAQINSVLTVIDSQHNNPVTVSTSNKRRKGEGTGRIQWRTITKKNGKQYKQPWYDWQIKEGEKTLSRCTYIPKRLLAKIEELEASKAPVREILKLLGAIKLNHN